MAFVGASHPGDTLCYILLPLFVLSCYPYGYSCGRGIFVAPLSPLGIGAVQALSDEPGLIGYNGKESLPGAEPPGGRKALAIPGEPALENC